MSKEFHFYPVDYSDPSKATLPDTEDPRPREGSSERGESRRGAASRSTSSSTLQDESHQSNARSLHQKVLTGGGNRKRGLVPRAAATTVLSIAQPTRCCKPDCSPDPVIIIPERVSPNGPAPTFGYVQEPIFGLTRTYGQKILPPRPCEPSPIVFLFFYPTHTFPTVPPSFWQNGAAMVLRGPPEDFTFEKVVLKNIADPSQPQIELAVSTGLGLLPITGPFGSAYTLIYWNPGFNGPHYCTAPGPCWINDSLGWFSVEFE